jgi:hypothetical protein
VKVVKRPKWCAGEGSGGGDGGGEGGGDEEGEEEVLAAPTGHMNGFRRQNTLCTKPPKATHAPKKGVGAGKGERRW